MRVLYTHVNLSDNEFLHSTHPVLFQQMEKYLYPYSQTRATLIELRSFTLISIHWCIYIT